MKFLCDKCKTRYSIGDDRVRGKILKIRCKNCANVITVREGMDISPSEPRRNATMAIQKVDISEVGGAAPQGALGAAFASQLTKPPPALEEEWYVSMDGNQEGPYSLGDAQRWVSAKPFEAELHCWSEGFDDWLPVDKVSHFRNLRKRPAPAPAPRTATIPPPIPKGPTRDEPKPLFAATMASIEKSAGAVPERARLPSLSTKSTGATAPLAGRTNGNGHALPSVRGTGALSSPFHEESPDAMTRVDSGEFPSDDVATTADPVAARRSEAMIDQRIERRVEAQAKLAPVKPIMDDGDDEDDGLDIGEVSRVVNLKDIASMHEKKATASNPALRVGGGTASTPALRNSTANLAALRTGMTGSHTKLSPSELGMNVDPALAPPGAPTPDESMLAQSFAQRHRRGMYILLGVSAVMVAGVVALVIFMTSGSDSDLPLGLGGTRTIDTSRPEDIVRKQLPPAPNAGTGTTTTTHKPTTGRPTGTGKITTTQPNEPETGPGSSLDAGEVEAMAAKYGEGTKRCYMRAQKGALGFEIADTKKIDVTLTVAKDGTVSEVTLSKHANNEFGQCLIARIKGWKFRESKGGTFRIALAFSAS